MNEPRPDDLSAIADKIGKMLRLAELDPQAETKVPRRLR